MRGLSESKKGWKLGPVYKKCKPGEPGHEGEIRWQGGEAEADGASFVIKQIELGSGKKPEEPLKTSLKVWKGQAREKTGQKPLRSWSEEGEPLVRDSARKLTAGLTIKGKHITI